MCYALWMFSWHVNVKLTYLLFHSQKTSPNHCSHQQTLSSTEVVTSIQYTAWLGKVVPLTVDKDTQKAKTTQSPNFEEVKIDFDVLRVPGHNKISQEHIFAFLIA